MIVWWLACAEPAAPPAPACDIGEGPACVCDTPGLRIGDGEADFVPLLEGQPVTVTKGAQGGWHITTSIEVTNTSDLVSLFYTIHRVRDDAEVSKQWLHVMLANAGPSGVEPTCVGTYWNMAGILDISALVDGERDTPPELLVGEPLRIEVEMEDQNGRTVCAQIGVVGAADPNDTTLHPPEDTAPEETAPEETAPAAGP